MKGKGKFKVLEKKEEELEKIKVGKLEKMLKKENKEKLRKKLKYKVVEGKVREKMKW